MRRDALLTLVLRVLLVVAIVGSWAYATGPGGVSPLLLPQIDITLERLQAIVQQGQLWNDLLLTVVEIVSAFALSVGVGVLVGFWASRTRLRAAVIEPLIAWGYMAPLVLFYPLFIVWFDIGPASKIAYGAVSGFFPVAFNSLRGFQAVDPQLLRVAKAFGATANQSDWLVKTPAALPMVMSGIRVGAALNVITVILAEMLASTRGLGYELAQASQTLQTANVFALILILLVVVAVLHTLIQLIGRTRHY